MADRAVQEDVEKLAAMVFLLADGMEDVSMARRIKATAWDVMKRGKEKRKRERLKNLLEKGTWEISEVEE